MASLLSILKKIINLNRIHIEKQEYVDHADTTFWRDLRREATSHKTAADSELSGSLSGMWEEMPGIRLQEQ